MGTATAAAVAASDSVASKKPSPKTKKASPQRNAADAKTDQSTKNDSNVEAAKPLAPPPRPGQQSQTQEGGSNSPDYFSQQPGGGSLNLEPNPFEQSFGGGAPETPGGTKLPSVHALTSPSSLLPGSSTTPFAWGGGSLRTGPLSPAMLSGPAREDYFGDTHHLRGGFPTPNESSLRSGLTPGGSGSMFPAPSPNSQAFIAQLQSGGATPSTLDFHRTAMSAAQSAKRESSAGQQAQPAQQQQQPQQPATSQPQEMTNGAAAVKSESKGFEGSMTHDNEAANGLFLLAQGRNGTQATNQFASTGQTNGQHNNNTSQPAHTNGLSRGGSENSNISDNSDNNKPAGRGKGKKNPPATTGRRKADEAPAKAPPSKKAKVNSAAAAIADDSGEPSDDEDDMKDNGDGTKSKMTDEEKRKNFLERNRVAALKCRQRKKQWLANLQSKVEMFSNENEALTAQITQLREEVVNLKTLLLAHKDCPVTQQQGMHGAFMNQVNPQVPPPEFNHSMNPYQMAGQMHNQQMMAGQQFRRPS